MQDKPNEESDKPNEESDKPDEESLEELRKQAELEQGDSLFSPPDIESLSDSDIEGFHTPPGDVTGDVESIIEVWDGRQSYPTTCAVRCEEIIIEVYRGGDIDEHVLVQEAYDKGWWRPGVGTSPEDIGNLLESHGIEINRFTSSNIFHLADELAKGHRVIIGVDSGELWNQMPFLEYLQDAFGFEEADHAVIVSGIDTTDPGNPLVIISDPGTGEAAAHYPLDEFLDAWEDSDFFMIATTEPPPVEYASELVNLDNDLFRNMLFQVAGMPFLSYLEGLWNDSGEEGDFPYLDLTSDPEPLPDDSSPTTIVDDPPPVVVDDEDVDVDFDDFD
jgi:hypothetical protein